MLKLGLPECQILQDTNFGLGGASGGTGKAGEAGPVETNVHLAMRESDEMMSEMPDLSAQARFLHAFRRTDMKTKIKVVGV